MQTQEAREQQMATLGRSRSRRIISKALEGGEAGMTPAGVALAKRAIEPLSAAIRAFMADAFNGMAGRRHVAANLLKDVDVDLTAFITVRSCLNAAPRRYTLKSTALALTERLETELIADAFEAENSSLYRAVIRNARSRGLAPERQAKAVLMANKQFSVVEKRWTPRERLLLGSKLVELTIESLGIIESVLVSTGKTKTHRLQLAPSTQEWFTKYNNAATLTRPMYLPTVIPPKPWEDPSAGPYYTPLLGTMSILSRSFPGQIDALRAADMTKVYAGLNGLQETPWRINLRVHDVMKEAWEMDAGLTCLPHREDEPIPTPPKDVQDDVVGGPLRKAWRQKVRLIHERNATARSGRFELARALAIAEENRSEGQIYFPHRLDFRGRAYAAATSLNPQGSDDVRGLLEFADGKPLGERGVFWLGVHGANLFGNDKVSLEERAKWAHDHSARALAVAGGPLDDLWWTEADKPWCFLAWCFEWADAYVSGDARKFVSHLPIALDGSCNGIQHFSAMLRDPVGGAAVNLVPSLKPQDIYQRVADRVIERLKEHETLEDENTWIAQGWLSYGIDRKTTKRPVMVLPYGGTFKSCLDYVRESVRDRFESRPQINPFGEIGRAHV